MTEDVLHRQLRRLGLSRDHLPDLQAWQTFVDRVGGTYAGFERDRYLLERSTTLAGAEMHQLHQALRRDRERLRAVIDSLDVGLVVLDAELTVELANPEAGRILGLPAARLAEWTVEDLQRCGTEDPQLHQLLCGLGGCGAASPLRGGLHDGRLRTADGRTVPVAVSVVPVEHLGTAMGAVILLRDLSEIQRLELQLRQAQKLEAVGRLAAGVAHELNTPIQFIGNNLRFLQDSTEDLLTAVEVATARTHVGDRDGSAPAQSSPSVDEGGLPHDLGYLLEDLPEAITESLEGVERVSSIVAAMKSFSHPGQTYPAAADVNQALRDTVIVARNEVKGIAEVVLAFDDLPAVECLIHDLKQVFLNLLINAAHAIVDRRATDDAEGLITIRTWQTPGAVAVSFEDNGCGMSAEIADHVFEPFFTTKEVGRGTGQGLALAHTIVVEGHHGEIVVESQPGRGTTFTIRLPLTAHRDPTVAASPTSHAAESPVTERGSPLRKTPLGVVSP